MNSPFDERKYKRLLKGLEVNEVMLSECLKSYRLRFDSEYYQKKYLKNESLLQSDFIIKDFCLDNILNIKSLKLNKPFNYLAIADVNLKNMEYQTTEIQPNEIPDRATYVLQDNDIAISTIRPNRNAVALVHNANRLVGTSGFTILRTNNQISPYYLFAFCKSEFFVTKLMRENTATMYPAVSDTDIYNVKIPFLPGEIIKQVENKVITALEKMNNPKPFTARPKMCFWKPSG